MTDIETTEWRNFFITKREVLDAKRTNQPTNPYIEELEVMALHTQQPLLKTAVSRFLSELDGATAAIA